jgi:hypothetical protein
LYVIEPSMISICDAKMLKVESKDDPRVST